MLATVAGCDHISVCIAGAMTRGARLASTVVPSRSSAMPAASLAIVLAVAGAMTMTSASWPRLTCRTAATSSKIDVFRGLRLRASQVGAPTNFSADSVAMTFTSWPASTRSRTT